MNNLSNRREAGFTLIEVLVSLTILSIAFAVLLDVFGTNLDRLSNSQAEAIALAHTQSLLAETGRTIALRLGDTSGDFMDGFQWRLHVELYGDDEDRKAWPANAVTVAASTYWEGGRKSITLTALRLAAKDPP